MSWLALGLLLGPALPPAQAAPPPEARARKAYQRTYRAHTRKLVVHRGFQTALTLRATLLTNPMRQALATERQRLLDPAPANHDAFVARMDADAAAYHELVFSADIPVDDLGRFGEGDATWNLRLLADGSEQTLHSVERIRRPTPVHRGLYPHLNLWSDLYIARFHRAGPPPSTVELRVGSGYGNGRIAWELPAGG